MTIHPSFWLFHTVGWAAYGLLWYLASLPMYGQLEATAGEAALRVGYYTVLGFGITAGLRPLYERLWARETALSTLIGVAVVASLVGGMLWGLLLEAVKWPLDAPVFHGKAWFELARGYVSTAFVVLAWSGLYLGARFNQLARRERERALEAEALAQKAQLQMLRYQLNPHFFFNALNSIRALIDEDPQKARQIVTAFSAFIRYTLLDADRRPTTLQDELDVIRAYLDVEKIRFEDRLQVDIDADPEAGAAELPPFLVHPLVENAVKHGLQAPGPLRITIHARRSGDTLRISVTNTGILQAPAAGSTSAGIGLANVRERLEQHYPGRHTFRLDEHDGEVRATMTIALAPMEVKA